MIFKIELRKLLLMPALWGFVLLSLLLNAAFVFNFNNDKTIDYINGVSSSTGTQYSEEYNEKLAMIKEPDVQEHYIENEAYHSIVASAENTHDQYADFDAKAELDALKAYRNQDGKPISKAAMFFLEKKYEKFDAVAEEKAKSGVSQSVYFADFTDRIHSDVFGTLSSCLMAESSIISLLLVLFSFEYERLSKADSVIYATRTGRKLITKKLAACVTCSAAVFALLYLVTYGATFIKFDFSTVWNTAVDSCNNGIIFEHNSYPYLLWDDMTVGQYFFAGVAVSFITSMLFMLLGSVLGAVMKNTYFAFGLIAAAVFLNYVAFVSPILNVSSLLYYLVRMTPLALIYGSSMWFGMGEMYMLFPHWETVLSAALLLIFSTLFILARKRFLKKNLT